MYDPKCHELAEYFIPTTVKLPRRMVTELAQHIQDAIEDWLMTERDRLKAEVELWETNPTRQ